MPQYTRIWWACGNFIIIIYKLVATVKRHTQEMTSTEIEEIIKTELQVEPDITNVFGLDLTKCLIKPTRQKYKNANDSTDNSTLAIGGVSSPLDSFVVAESSVLRTNFCAEKPAHRQSAKQSQFYHRTIFYFQFYQLISKLYLNEKSNRH
jgi:hypothetical protein